MSNGQESPCKKVGERKTAHDDGGRTCIRNTIIDKMIARIRELSTKNHGIAAKHHGLCERTLVYEITQANENLPNLNLQEV